MSEAMAGGEAIGLDAETVTIGRKSLLVFYNSILGGALGLVSIVLVAHYIGPTSVGRVQYSLGLLGLFYFMTDFSFGPAHTKRVSEGVDEGDCLTTFTAVKLFATTLFAILGGAFAIYAHFYEADDLLAGTLLAITLYYAIKALGAIPNATFDARRETARSQLGVLVENIISLSLQIALALLVAGAISHQGPAAGKVVPAVGALGFIINNQSLFLALTSVFGTTGALFTSLYYLRRTGKWGRFRWDILKSYWAFALPLATVGFVVVIATNVDRAALGFFGTAADAGYFGYARKIGVFIETIPVAIASLLFPTISRLNAQGNNAGIQGLRETASRYTSLFIMPFIGFTIILARPIVHIFLGDQWLPAYPALAILGIFSLAYTMGTPHTTFLSGTGRTSVLARIAISTAVLNIILNIILIPPNLGRLGLPGVRLAGLSVTGAAIATTTSMVVSFLLYRWAASGVSKVHDGFLLKHAFATIVMVAVIGIVFFLMFGVQPYGDAPFRIYDFLLFIVLGTVAYFGILFVMGEFASGELKFVGDVLNPVEMARYIRTELHLGKKGGSS
ncbi:MAG: oligosaccharide flippase family protein [Thermoplasmatota archaeon]